MFWIILGFAAWYVMGLIGSVMTLSKDNDISLFELPIVAIGGLPGPIMLICALLEAGKIWNPVIVKKRDS
jgi:hypothetical protein